MSQQEIISAIHALNETIKVNTIVGTNGTYLNEHVVEQSNSKILELIKLLNQ